MSKFEAKDNRHNEISQLIEAKMIDESIINTLEEYVNQQVKNQTYDFDANRHLLKLYRFFPQSYNNDIVMKLLCKALMQLPKTDFLACSYLIEEENFEKFESLKSLRTLFEHLESCQFPAFWKNLNNFNGGKQIPLFNEAVQRFVASIVSITFQTVSTSTLKELLNIQDDAKLNNFLQSNNWQLSNDGQTVTLPLNASNQPPKPASVEQISLDQMAKVMGSFAY